jgi:hypothetical protein
VAKPRVRLSTPQHSNTLWFQKPPLCTTLVYVTLLPELSASFNLPPSCAGVRIGAAL